MLPRITKIKKKMNTGNKCRSLSEQINIGNPINSLQDYCVVSQSVVHLSSRSQNRDEIGSSGT